MSKTGSYGALPDLKPVDFKKFIKDSMPKLLQPRIESELEKLLTKNKYIIATIGEHNGKVMVPAAELAAFNEMLIDIVKEVNKINNSIKPDQLDEVIKRKFDEFNLLDSLLSELKKAPSEKVAESQNVTYKLDLLKELQFKFPELQEKDISNLINAAKDFVEKDLKSSCTIKGTTLSIPLSDLKALRSYLSEFNKIELVKNPEKLYGKVPLNIKQPPAPSQYASISLVSPEKANEKPKEQYQAFPPRKNTPPVAVPAKSNTPNVTTSSQTTSGQYGSMEAVTKQPLKKDDSRYGINAVPILERKPSDLNGYMDVPSEEAKPSQHQKAPTDLQSKTTPKNNDTGVPLTEVVQAKSEFKKIKIVYDLKLDPNTKKISEAFEKLGIDPKQAFEKLISEKVFTIRESNPSAVKFYDKNLLLLECSTKNQYNLISRTLELALAELTNSELRIAIKEKYKDFDISPKSYPMQANKPVTLEDLKVQIQPASGPEKQTNLTGKNPFAEQPEPSVHASKNSPNFDFVTNEDFRKILMIQITEEFKTKYNLKVGVIKSDKDGNIVIDKSHYLAASLNKLLAKRADDIKKYFNKPENNNETKNLKDGLDPEASNIYRIIAKQTLQSAPKSTEFQALEVVLGAESKSHKVVKELNKATEKVKETFGKWTDKFKKGKETESKDKNSTSNLL